jgi:(1->4)-alpha-D-glucan 1-alpha-D-glucosylmutase
VSELRATYRLQLGPHLTFDDARALVPYVRELGISHLYLSPSLQARSGSTHGYDVVDPTTVSEELGGEEALRALAAEIGLILDIVPNHMGTGDENRWWPDPKVFDIDEQTGFYRRFFDIDDLGAVRQEDDEVFELTHRKTLELLRDGFVDGVRVDHPDGLADPAGYFAKLRDARAPHVWIEKILHPGEPMRDWPVDGTVGYEFLNDCEGLLVDRSGEEFLTSLYGELTGETRSFDQVAREAQLEMATTTFQREVDWLQRLAPDLDGIPEALADLPVYRTYVEPWSGQVDPLDRRYVEAARMPRELAGALLLEEGGNRSEFVTRFQQTSPPVTAKGVEDTAFYRYNRLLALNEVGGDPGRFGITIEQMHAGNLERAQRFPRNLLVSSTHDTKRSADVRARIGTLASPDLREDFAALARTWVPRAPDPNEGWMLLQTLLGAWPIEPLERLDGFIEKALREAKVNTNWVDQDHDHEARVKRFARELLDDADFRRPFDVLNERVAAAGRRSSVAQLALRLTSPGIPDVYGGDELDYFALVDPDNRRPVDYDTRRERLGADDRAREPKLRLIHSVLELRRRRPEPFAGAYEPVDAGEDVIAFARGEGEVLVVVPTRPRTKGKLRLSPALEGRWREVASGGEIQMSDGIAVPGGGAGVFERL